MNEIKIGGIILTRRLICALSFVLVLISLSGCAQSEDVQSIAKLMGDNQTLQARIVELENQKATQTIASSDSIAYCRAIGVNCVLYPSGGDRISASSELDFPDTLAVCAIAKLPEGMTLEFWRVNGTRLESQEQEILIDVKGNTVIEAVLRHELKVTALNAYMQFLDEKDKPIGEKFTEYVFENDTDSVSGKKISIFVSANIPKDYEIDYWRINGVAYHFNKAVTSFIVYELSDPASYEAILKKKPVKSSPKPKQSPRLVA